MPPLQLAGGPTRVYARSTLRVLRRRRRRRRRRRLVLEFLLLQHVELVHHLRQEERVELRMVACSNPHIRAATAWQAYILPTSCALMRHRVSYIMRASGGTMKIPGQRPKLNTPHSSTGLGLAQS